MTLIWNVIHGISCLEVMSFVLAMLGYSSLRVLLVIAECLRAPTLAKPSHEIGPVRYEPDPRPTNTGDVRFQAAFAVCLGRTLLDVAQFSGNIADLANMSRGYESEEIWKHWHFP
jgi:hypothetical protein